MNLTHYAKLLGPFIVAVLISILTFTRDTDIGVVGATVYALSIVLAIANVAITYRWPNELEGFGKYAKFWANVVHAALQAVLLIVATGVGVLEFSLADWSTVALAAIAAVSVRILPNEPELLAVDRSDALGITKVYANDAAYFDHGLSDATESQA